MNAAELQVLGSAARRRRRRDGRGAAARRVQPEHQGAGRLLGRACSPPTASCSRRPSTSRCTSARCRRRCAAAIDALGDVQTGRPGDPQRPVRRRHPPQRHHAGRAVLRRRRARRLGRRTAPTTPTSAAPRPARCRPTRTEIHQEGLRIPPVLLDDRRRARCSSPTSRTPDERARRPRRPGRRQPARRRRVRARRDGGVRVGAAVRRGRSTTASGACAPRSRDLPDGRWPFADVLDSTGPRPEQQRPIRIVVDGDASTATTITFDFTGTDAQRPGNVNAVEAVTVSAVAFALRGGHRPDDPGQRRRAAPGARRRAAGHRRRRGAAGRGRRRQRRGEPAGRRRVPRRARPGRARAGRRRRPGHDEQRAHRRDEPAVGVLRDHRRRAGRPAVGAPA